MPCLNIVTNVQKTKIPKDFVDRIIPVLSKSVGRPEDVFICAITGDAHLHMFGDSKTPGAVASLESIGNLGPEENQLISRQLSDYVKKEIGVEPGRFFLSFYDLKSHEIGIRGTTAACL
ncbi:hypothetical protein O0L34_g2377 [Tuta absoluta]|nr:hypothetical protein O0L34_g2377 [Tuta absoluta]